MGVASPVRLLFVRYSDPVTISGGRSGQLLGKARAPHRFGSQLPAQIFTTPLRLDRITIEQLAGMQHQFPVVPLFFAVVLRSRVAKGTTSAVAWSWLGAAMQATKMPFGVISAPGYRYHPAVLAPRCSDLKRDVPRALVAWSRQW